MSEVVNTPYPQCLSMLFAEKILREPNTNLQSLISLFDRIIVSHVPAQYSFCIYLLVVNVQGVDIPLDVRIVGPSGKINPVGKFDLTPKPPSKNAEVILNFQSAIFEAEGTYTIEAYLLEQRIAARELTIEVATIPIPPENVAEAQ